MSKLFFVCFASGAMAAAWTIGSYGGELCASKTASAILAAPSRELLPKPESRTDEAPPQDLQDFDARCKAPGVVVCQGFDSPLINIAAKWPGAGLYPGQDYDCLSLLTYMTNKDANLDHPTAYAWYDELIVSTQPIAARTPAVVP